MSEAVLDAATLAEGDAVLVLGGSPSLVFGAHGRIGDGWVYAVDPQVGELERLLAAAHEEGVAGIAYLVGGAAVLPLPDASVTAVVGSPFADAREPVETARELHRVLAAGGRISIEATDVVEAALRAAGFADVARAGDASRPRLTARKP